MRHERGKKKEKTYRQFLHAPALARLGRSAAMEDMTLERRISLWPSLLFANTRDLQWPPHRVFSTQLKKPGLLFGFSKDLA